MPNLQPLFHNLFVGATYEYVDAFLCILVTKTSEVSEHAVCKLIQLYEFSGPTQRHGTHNAGFSLGTDTTSVIHISESEVDQIGKGRNDWYGMVDGLHSRKAFSWMVSNMKY